MTPKRAEGTPGHARRALRRLHAAAGDPADEGPPVRPRKPVRDRGVRAGDRGKRATTSRRIPSRSGSRSARDRRAPARSRSSCASSSPSRPKRPRLSTFPTRSPTRPPRRSRSSSSSTGPNVTVTQKDPSALNALLFASLAISTGRARAMLAGGVDEWNAYYALGFDRVSALRGQKKSLRDRPGRGRLCAPPRGRSLRARARRAAARAPRGIAVAGVPTEPYRFAPDPDAMARAMSRGARGRGRLAGGRRALVFPSRDGVDEMDAAEAEALGRLFGSPPPQIEVKQAIGEMAASGGGQFVAACRAVADPEGPFAGNGRPRRALVNSFGAGGNFLAAVSRRSPTGRRRDTGAPRGAAARGILDRHPCALRRVRLLRRRLARPLRALSRAGPRSPDRRARIHGDARARARLPRPDHPHGNPLPAGDPRGHGRPRHGAPAPARGRAPRARLRAAGCLGPAPRVGRDRAGRPECAGRAPPHASRAIARLVREILDSQPPARPVAG